MDIPLEFVLKLEKDYDIKLMVPPYRYCYDNKHNMEINKYCAICNRRIGMYEFILKDEFGNVMCQQCHLEHIAGVNISTIAWFKNLDIDLRDDFSMKWIPRKTSNLIEFTFWLANQPKLKYSYYSAPDKTDKKNIPLIDGLYLPQHLETKALNIWFTEVGINKKDCTFRTLDTFPNFKNKYEDIMIIYNNPNKKHFNKDGILINMKINPISDLLGENILGSLVFINKTLINDDVLDSEYTLRAPKFMSDGSQ